MSRNINKIRNYHKSSLHLNCIVVGTPIMRTQVTPTNSKALSVLWGPLDEFVVTGHEDGCVIKWDMRTGKKVSSILCLTVFQSGMLKRCLVISIKIDFLNCLVIVVLYVFNVVSVSFIHIIVLHMQMQGCRRTFHVRFHKDIFFQVGSK